MKKAIPIRPIPTDPADATRWEHSALRLRMLLGVWDKDLERKLEKYLDPQRRAAWGGVDLSSNVFKSITSQLACLFDKQPTVFHPSGAAELIAPGGAIDKAGLYPMMANFQAKVLGLREYAMRVNYDPKFGLRYRPVAPCDMIASALPENPDTPTRIEALRLREHPKSGRPMWTYDVLDVSDSKAPIYEIRGATSTPTERTTRSAPRVSLMCFSTPNRLESSSMRFRGARWSRALSRALFLCRSLRTRRDKPRGLSATPSGSASPAPKAWIGRGRVGELVGRAIRPRSSASRPTPRASQW